MASEVRDKMAVIGVGGILSGEDAARKIELGADLVQIYTGFIYRGPALVVESAKAILFRAKKEAEKEAKKGP